MFGLDHGTVRRLNVLTTWSFQELVIGSLDLKALQCHMFGWANSPPGITKGAFDHCLPIAIPLDKKWTTASTNFKV